MQVDAFEGVKYVNALTEIQWLRVIMDEGHELKAPSTKKFRTIFKLEAKNKWIVSATPFRNWQDFFNLLKLLHFPSYNLMAVSSKSFKGFLHSPDLSQLVKAPLQQALRALVCGRSVGSSPERPPVVFQTHLVDFESKEQKELYALLREGTGRVIQGMISAGTLKSHPMRVLAALRRLREAAAGCGARFSLSDVQEQMKAQGKWFQLSGQVQGQQNYREATEEPIGDTEECAICTDVHEIPLQTRCNHLFCEDCILAYMNLTREPSCPVCREKLSMLKDNEKHPKDLFLPKGARAAAASANSDKERESGKTEAIGTVAQKKDKVVMSAKIKALGHLLRLLQEKEPRAKVIVFSQFSGSLKEISKFLFSQSIKHAAILGSFSSAKRSQAPLFGLSYISNFSSVCVCVCVFFLFLVGSC